MRLYAYGNGLLDYFFDTEEQLIEFLNNRNTDVINSLAYIIDFMGGMASRKNVVRKTFMDGSSRFETGTETTDETLDAYAIYNESRSFYRGEFFWEANYGGNIRAIYDAFGKRGLVFENDIYLLTKRG